MPTTVFGCPASEKKEPKTFIHATKLDPLSTTVWILPHKINFDEQATIGFVGMATCLTLSSFEHYSA